jgi:hypothetical protein
MIAIIPEPVIGMSRNTDRHGPESPRRKTLLLYPRTGSESPGFQQGVGQRTIGIISGWDHWSSWWRADMTLAIVAAIIKLFAGSYQGEGQVAV